MKRGDIVIGASEAAAAIGLSRFKSPARLYFEKTGAADRGGDSDAAWLGRHIEHALATAIEAREGVKLRAAQTLRSTSLPWLRATPDRVLLRQDMPESFARRWGFEQDEHALLELKTTGLASWKTQAGLADEWGVDGSDHVPLGYVVQTLLQAHVVNEHCVNGTVLGVPGHVTKVLVGALIPGRGLAMFCVVANPHATTPILSGLVNFVEQHLVPEVPPQAESEADWKLVAQQVQQPRTSKEMIAADHDLAALAVQYRDVCGFAQQFAVEKAELKAKLTSAIGSRGGIVGDFGRLTLCDSKGAPALSKPKFADAVIDLVTQHKGSTDQGRAEFAAELDALRLKHTAATFRARTLKSTWASGDTDTDNE